MGLGCLSNRGRAPSHAIGRAAASGGLRSLAAHSMYSRGCSGSWLGLLYFFRRSEQPTRTGSSNTMLADRSRYSTYAVTRTWPSSTTNSSSLGL